MGPQTARRMGLLPVVQQPYLAVLQKPADQTPLLRLDRHRGALFRPRTGRESVPWGSCLDRDGSRASSTIGAESMFPATNHPRNARKQRSFLDASVPAVIQQDW